ncbi:MAG: HDIG domain-containing protein [Treponema sp.]|nr:HDIG domain-containing protein [Treponema sp.]
MKAKKTEFKSSVLSVFFENLGNYVKVKYPFLILFFLGFLAVCAVTLVKVSTSESVARFALNDFEIGQVADRDIIANKSLPPDGMDPVAIQKGERIIHKGFVITEEAYAKLKKMSVSPIYIDYRAFANIILFLFLVAVAWYLLYSFLPFNRKIKMREVILQTIFFLIVYSATAFGSKVQLFSTQYSLCIIIPASLCVMLVTILYDDLAAVLFSVIMSIGVLVASGWQLPPFLYTLATSLSSVAIVRKIERRIDLVLSSIMLSIFNAVYMFVLLVIFNESLTDSGSLIIGVMCNAFFSGIMTLGFLTPLEYILNSSSVFRLMDLSDLNNNPLMQKMLVTASGTYNHSLMVAQLAETACREIGANALIARVGAYYHDIGKIDQSEYFVENQKGENKHDEINPSLSASVIKSHVKKGVEKAHQMHLPQAVIDIISEHHGNSVITYFYNEAKAKDPTVSPEDYSYPGNPPSTRESAVVMLADTVEAACRTLENPSVTSLEKFITTLINAKVEHNQLDNCDLTFRDISKIKEAFVQILAGYYHSRIEYPDQKEEENKEKAEKSEKQTKADKSDKNE